MAGRAGHLALARSFERHHVRLRDVEQDRTRLGFNLRALFAVGVVAGDAHPFTPCHRAAPLMAMRPSRSTASFILRPTQRRIDALWSASLTPPDGSNTIRTAS